MPPLKKLSPLKKQALRKRRLDEKFNPESQRLIVRMAKVLKGRPLVSEKVRAAIERAMM
jgi:DNA topoisomerase VI subunit B